MLTEKDIDQALEILREVGIHDTKIDEDAAKILNSATHTVKEILSRREALDKAGRKNEPLVVIMGENHTYPANYAHHIAVITQLQKAEPQTALAMELTHSQPQRLAQKNNDKKDPVSYKRTFNEATAREDALYSFAYNNYIYAPYARNMLLHSCLENDIPVKFTDTLNKHNKLDITDPSTRESLETTRGPVWETIHCVSPEGLNARNHHMVKVASDFAEKSRGRIIVQQCGNFHVLGKENTPPGQGLVTQFKKAGLPVTAHFLQNQKYYLSLLSPRDQVTKDAFIQTAEELPRYGAVYKSALYTKNKTTVSYSSILGSHEKEAAYTNALLAKMNMKQYGMNTDNYVELRQKRKIQINKQLGISPDNG